MMFPRQKTLELAMSVGVGGYCPALLHKKVRKIEWIAIKKNTSSLGNVANSIHFSSVFMIWTVKKAKNWI